MRGPGWNKILYWIFVVDMLLLGYLGIQPPSDGKTLLAQAGTLFYFGFFLLMPWWSRLGEFKRVPDPRVLPSPLMRPAPETTP